MKKTLLLLAGLFIALNITAQNQNDAVLGNGKYVKEKREIPTYDKIHISGNFDVTITSGKEGIIKLEGDENIISLVDSKVSNGTLIIKTAENRPFHSKKKIAVTIPASVVNEITLKGCGSVTSRKVIRNNIKTTVDGSGIIKLKVNADISETYVLGSGSTNISGRAANYKCYIVGSGMVNACSFEAANVDALVSGAGSAKVKSYKKIKGRISGSGNIAFSGNPADKDLKRMGTGEFRML